MRRHDGSGHRFGRGILLPPKADLHDTVPCGSETLTSVSLFLLKQASWDDLRAGCLVLRGLSVYLFEFTLSHAADGAFPIIGQVLKGGLGGDACIRVSLGRIVNVVTDCTAPLSHDFFLLPLVTEFSAGSARQANHTPVRLKGEASLTGRTEISVDSSFFYLLIYAMLIFKEKWAVYGTNILAPVRREFYNRPAIIAVRIVDHRGISRLHPGTLMVLGKPFDNALVLRMIDHVTNRVI